MMVFNVPTLHILIRFNITTYTQFLRSAELFSVQHDRKFIQSKDYETEYEVKDEDTALEQEQHHPVPGAPVLGIRMMCCGSGSGIRCPFDPWTRIRNPE
jgi:hypothetical protein